MAESERKILAEVNDSVVEFDGRSRLKIYSDSFKLCDKLTKELSNYVEVMHRNNMTVTAISEGYIRKLHKRIITLRMAFENLHDDEHTSTARLRESGDPASPKTTCPGEARRSPVPGREGEG